MFLKKRKSLIALFVAFLAVVVFALGAVCFVQSSQTAYATATNSETIDFGSDGISFDDKAALDELITLLGGSDYDDLCSKLTDSKTASEFVNAKTVTLGGVAFNIMYVSKADYTANGTTAGDVIVTLWQADTDSGADYCLKFNPWVAENTDYAYPASMYGSSLIRSALMDKNNAERKYVKTADASELTAYNSSDDNYQTLLEARWAPFKDSDGAFNGYLATPANMAWQESQYLSAVDGSFYLPNGAWDASKLSGASWDSMNKNGLYINIGDIKDKSAYSDWKNDRVWLPSLTETGRVGNASGLWKTSTTQRANTNYNYAWLRSGSSNSAAYVYYLPFNGNNIGLDAAASISTFAVRPALHLNLKSIDEAATPKPYEVTVGATTTKYLTFEEAWNAAGNAGTATVKMFADAEVSSTLEVSADKNITLDLNGKKITYTGESGSVIKIDGTFTLEDDGTGTHLITSPVTDEVVAVDGGLITGGKGTAVSGTVLGGAVYVTGMGVFTMNGGTLADNTALDGYGGAVRSDGTFNLVSGCIMYNKSGFGGGVYVTGTFVMTDGTVSENTALSDGGGVYNNGTFKVSGKPEIIGNLVNGDAFNVSANKRIVVAGELTEGAKIGISGAGEVATGFTQTTGKPSEFFIPDNFDYSCVYVSDKAAGTVNISSTHSGGTATCVAAKTCTNCGAIYGAVDSSNHTYGTPSYTWLSDNSTCTAERVCTFHSNSKETETVTADLDTTAPTCTVGGFDTLTATFTNSAFATQTKQINQTSATEHSPAADDNDCTTEIKCSVCQAVTTAAQEHDFSGGYTSNDTQHWHVCAHIGCTQTDTKTNHNCNQEVATDTYFASDATCATVALYYKSCVCGFKGTETFESGNPLGHNYSTDFTVDTEATCTTAGSKSKHCSRCSEKTDVTEIPALGHNYATEWSKDESGHWYAATCEHTTEKSEFAEHTAGDWIVDTPAQVGVAGSKHKECTVCGYTTETAEIPAIIPEHQHTFSTEWSKDESGHWYAATCEHTTEKSEFATHTVGDWIVDTPAQIGVAGSKHKQCTVCGYTTETAEIESLVAELVKPGENGGENQVIVTIPNGFTPDIELVVMEIKQENYGNYEAIAQTVNGEINLVYNITLKSNGVTIQPEGTLTIRLRIPKNLVGKSFNLFHLHEDTATDMEYTVDGAYAVVTTDRLSEFIFVSEKIAPAPAPGDSDNNANGLSAGAIAGISISVVLAVLMATYIALYFTLYRKGVLKGKAFDVIYVPMKAIFKKKEN